MGRHSRTELQGLLGTRSAAVGAAKYVGRVGALALMLGVGVAVAGGIGLASADDTADGGAVGGGDAHSPQDSTAGQGFDGGPAAVASPADGSSAGTPRKPGSFSVPKMMLGSSGGAPNSRRTGHQQDPVLDSGAAEAIARVPHPIAALVSDGAAGASRPSPAPAGVRREPRPAKDVQRSAGPARPANPQAVDAVSSPSADPIGGQGLGVSPQSAGVPESVSEVGQVNHVPASVPTPVAPRPTDVAHTDYADVGVWMLQSNGQISNWGGKPYEGRTLLEPVNVIVIDPDSKNSVQSTIKLNAAMARAGFPAQPVHSTGFQGTIDGETYGQQPGGIVLAFSDNFFLLPNDHGRMFGPALAAGGEGYVWTGAFSTETLDLGQGQLGHEYVSSTIARDELVRRLVLSGGATVVDVVPIGNAVDTATETTGDHDGYAVVLRLNPIVAAPPPRRAAREDDSAGSCRSLVDILGYRATVQCMIAGPVSNAVGRHAKV